MKKFLPLILAPVTVFSIFASVVDLWAAIRYEETTSGIVYQGSWLVHSDTNASGGSYVSAVDAATPASATLTFTGTGVSWITDVWDDGGIARVYLDGVLDATVDLYSATLQYQREVYSKAGLPSGPHTIKIEVTGTKNASSMGIAVTVDAIEVVYASFQVRTDLNPLSSFPKDSAATGVIQPSMVDFGTPFDGYRFWCYYNPYPPESSEVVWLVRSNDGIIWTDAGVTNPVFPAPPGIKSAAHPKIFLDGTTWYLYADGKDLADGDYKIFYATASNPEGPWAFGGVVVSPTATWERYTVGSARVMKDGNIWKMWYDNADPSGSFVGYATAPSPAGPWTKYSGNPIFGPGASGQWDDVAVHHIDVIKDGAQFIMLYTGYGGDGSNSLGIASSYDGLTWSREKSNPVLTFANEPWNSITLYQGTIRRVDGNLKIWFTGATTTALAGAQIGLAEEVQLNNNPPATPGTPTGPTSGSPGVSNTYSVSTTDPDGNQIRYTFDWGDGTTTTTALANSGTTVTAAHSWGAAGSYSVQVMATDALGASSGWSAALSVVITAGGPNGLVAAYSFNEGAGSTVTDLSGNGNTGTIAGAIWTTAGQFGGALSFNGSTSMVTVNESNSLDLTSEMTLEAWIKPTTLSGWRTAVLKERSGSLVSALYANTSANRPNGTVVTSIGAYELSGTATLPLNTWTHLATTFDGATLRLYVNSVLVSSQAASGAIVTSTLPLRIGGNSVWGEYFAGLIDEVRVYNRALSQTEIQTDMNTPM